MRDWLLKALAGTCASAPLLVLLMLSLVMVGKDVTAPRTERAPAATGAPTAAGFVLPDAIAGWLEQAANTYQSDIAKKLSVPRHAGLVPSGAPPPAQSSADAAPGTMTTAVDAALRYITFWIEQAFHAAGYAPSDFAYSAVALLADQTARDARAFVEARKKAETDWNEAVERANAAAAEAASKDAERKSAADRDAAEAERRRAEARKEELRKLKEDLDRRIEDGLKKLEELEKLDATKKTEATRQALVADVARGASESLKAVQEARRKKQHALAEKEIAESKARYAREVAEAENARKVAEADQLRKAAEARIAEEKRLAELKATEARQAAEAEIARKAEAERKAEEARKTAEAAEARKADEDRKATAARAAEEKRLAEARADDARRVAAAESDRKRLDRDQAHSRADETQKAVADRPVAGSKSGDDTDPAAADAARTAEIKAIEERRRTAAEEARKADDARQAAVSTQLPLSSVQRPSTDVSGGKDTAAETPPQAGNEQRADASPAPAPGKAAPREKELRASHVAAKPHIFKSRRAATKAARVKRKAYGRKRAVRDRVRIHVVRRGETLWSISRRYLGNGKRYRTIYRANRDIIRNPHRIYPGQRLRMS